MSVFEACNLYRIWTALLKEGLMESNRACRDFAGNTAGEGMELFHCISLAFAEARHSFWKKCTILPKSARYHMQMNCLTVLLFLLHQQVSKTKQNENLIKMLLRAGVDVNATDFVSGFIQLPLWLVCMQQY